MMPFAAMRLRKSALSKSVSLVGAGGMVISTSVSTLSLAINAGAVAGDLFLAVVMRRSAAAALPSGWTLLSATAAALDNVGTTQYTDVYSRTAVAGDSNFTFGQSAAGRMTGQIIGLRGSTGTPVLDSQSTAIISNTSTSTIPLPVITASGDGRMALTAASIIAVSATPTATGLGFDNSWSLRSPASIDQNRLAVATKPLASGGTTAGNMTAALSASATGLTANALIFSAP